MRSNSSQEDFDKIMTAAVYTLYTMYCTLYIHGPGPLEENLAFFYTVYGTACYSTVQCTVPTIYSTWCGYTFALPLQAANIAGNSSSTWSPHQARGT